MVWVVGQVVNYIPKSIFSFLHRNCFPWTISWSAGDVPASLAPGWTKWLSWKNNVIGSHMCNLHISCFNLLYPFSGFPGERVQHDQGSSYQYQWINNFQEFNGAAEENHVVLKSSCRTEQPFHPALPAELGCLMWNIRASI